MIHQWVGAKLVGAELPALSRPIRLTARVEVAALQTRTFNKNLW